MNLRIPKKLRRALKRQSRREGRTSSSIVITALRCYLQDKTVTLEQRLVAIERRLSLDVVTNTSAESLGPFLGDFDQLDAVLPQKRRDMAYRQWLRHYEDHPEQCEPDRSAHEMAALKASTA